MTGGLAVVAVPAPPPPGVLGNNHRTEGDRGANGHGRKANGGKPTVTNDKEKQTKKNSTNSCILLGTIIEQHTKPPFIHNGQHRSNANRQCSYTVSLRRLVYFVR